MQVCQYDNKGLTFMHASALHMQANISYSVNL